MAHVLSIQGFSAANPEWEFAEESKSQKTQKSFMPYSPQKSQKIAKHQEEIKGLRWAFSWVFVQSKGRERPLLEESHKWVWKGKVKCESVVQWSAPSWCYYGRSPENRPSLVYLLLSQSFRRPSAFSTDKTTLSLSSWILLEYRLAMPATGRERILERSRVYKLSFQYYLRSSITVTCHLIFQEFTLSTILTLHKLWKFFQLNKNGT